MCITYFYLKGQSDDQFGPDLERGGDHNVTVWDDATLLFKRRAAGFWWEKVGITTVSLGYTQSCESEFIQVNPDPVRIQGFDDQKLKENATENV